MTGDLSFPCPRCGAGTIPGFMDRYCAAECDLVRSKALLADTWAVAKPGDYAPVSFSGVPVIPRNWTNPVPPLAHRAVVRLPKGKYGSGPSGPVHTWLVYTRDDKPPTGWTEGLNLNFKEAAAQLAQGYVQYRSSIPGLNSHLDQGLVGVSVTYNIPNQLWYILPPAARYVNGVAP